jgi:SOS-response transcriptional repressor LexA
LADFAKYLKEAREAAGLNQLELAEQVGLTGSYISVLESRRKPPPSDPVLKRMAKALGKPEQELLEVAHLDRTPEDIRKKIRALDRRLSMERKVTHSLLNDILPGSLWHFGRVRGYPEYGLEKLRLDAKKKRILTKVIRRIGHLTARDDFEEESRLVIDTLPAEDRSVLAEVLPELVRDLPQDSGLREDGKAESAISLPLLNRPPREGAKAATEQKTGVAVVAADHHPGRYFLKATDDDMSPRVEPGDLLLVAPDLAPADGALAVVRIGKRVTVREVHAAKQGILLVAANPKVRTSSAPESAVLGVITELRRSLA